MFYLRTEVDGAIVDVDIYGDDIYTRCVECGKEIQVDEKLLGALLKDDDFDFASTSLFCRKCSKKMKNKER